MGKACRGEDLRRESHATAFRADLTAIIPAAGERHSLTQGSFWMFDDTRVRIETVSASLTITQPRDIALYARVFELLRQSALYGRDARRLIGRALRDLAEGPG